VVLLSWPWGARTSRMSVTPSFRLIPKCAKPVRLTSQNPPLAVPGVTASFPKSRFGVATCGGCEEVTNYPTRLTHSSAPAATLLVRLVVGGVFLSEGVQKFLFPVALGVERFAKIGIPVPAITAPFVGVIEILCGLLLLLGLMTRLAAVPLIVDMLVAIATTKIPIFIKSGFFTMAHEARTDYSMLLGAIFLLIVGSGSVSLDSWLNRKVFSSDD
jgi:putative oxidoreductase